MKIYAWNIGMAATIPSNNGYKLCNWIIHEILSDGPDCFILTEFVVAEGIEYFWKKLKEKNYHWFINSATKGNGIMIAIKADSFGFDTTFDYSKLTVKTACDALKGNDLPDFYEIQVAWENQPLSIIGVRIKVDKNSQKNIQYKRNQFNALDEYLSTIEHNVICIGDYNAYWGNLWSTSKNTTMKKTMMSGYTLHTPDYGVGEWYSYVQSDGKANQLDHLITNIKNNKISVEYNWDFLKPLRYTKGITKVSVGKPSGMPDHAILKCTISDK